MRPPPTTESVAVRVSWPCASRRSATFFRAHCRARAYISSSLPGSSPESKRRPSGQARTFSHSNRKCRIIHCGLPTAHWASYRLARVGGYELCRRRRELIVRNFGSSNCLAKPIRCVRVRTVRRHFDAKPVGHRCWRHAPVTQIGHDAVAANRPPHGGLVGCLTAYLAGIKLTQPREQEILGVRPHADLLGGVGVGIVCH